MHQTPAPPVPTPPAVPPIPAIAQGGGLPTSVDPAALQAQLAELRVQHTALQAQWTSLRRQLEAMTQTNPGRPPVARQWGDIGIQIAQVEHDIAVVQARLGQQGTTTTPPPLPRSGPDPDMVAGMSLGLLIIVAIPLSIAWARRIWRGKPVAAGPRYDEFNQRFDRLEQAVDAIAIEVERVSEGQRFVTKILSERPTAAASDSSGSAQPLALGAGPAEPIRVSEREGVRQAR